MASVSHDFGSSTVNATVIPVQTRNIGDNTIFLKLKFTSMGNTRLIRENNNGVPAAPAMAATVFTDAPQILPATDGPVSEGFTINTDADKRRLKHTKRLLESPELASITREDNQFRLRVARLCLPYDDGILLLPHGMIERVERILTEYQTVIRPQLVETFIAAYEALKAEARASLGSLYNPADYPTVEGVRAKFRFYFNFQSFGVPGELQSISAALYRTEAQKVERQMQAAAENIITVLRQDAFNMVARLEERLTPGDDGKKKKLHETAVTGLQEFVSTLALRNVANDTELQAVVDRIQAMVEGTNVERLRESDLARKEIREALNRVSGTLATMVETRAGRVIRDE